MQISFAVTAKLISAFVFAKRIVQSLFYLYPKFQASSIFLCLCSSVCVGPVQKPHCWFSHEAAQLFILTCAHNLLIEILETYVKINLKLLYYNDILVHVYCTSMYMYFIDNHIQNTRNYQTMPLLAASASVPIQEAGGRKPACTIFPSSKTH